MFRSSVLPIIGGACCNRDMLTGEKLGAAVKSAMKKKGVTQITVADEFGIKQPSVSEWTRFGRVGKEHLVHLVEYFSDVVGPEHWGLPPTWGKKIAPAPTEHPQPDRWRQVAKAIANKPREGSNGLVMQVMASFVAQFEAEMDRLATLDAQADPKVADKIRQGD